MHDLDEIFQHKDNAVIGFLQEKKEKKIVLFGASGLGREVFEWLAQLGIEVDFFCDNNTEKWGTFFCGRKVIPPEELVKNKVEMKVLISSQCKSSCGIWMQLRLLGIEDILDLSAKQLFNSAETISSYETVRFCRSMLSNQDKIKQAYDLLADKESKAVYKAILSYRQKPDPKMITGVSESERYYFNEPFLTYREDEVLVDGGALFGDSVYDFCLHTNFTFKAVHCFEPMKESYQELEKTMSKLPANFRDKILLHNSGLYSKNMTLNFQKEDNRPGAAHIATDGESAIAVISIDEQFKGQGITFIKMDIEGSELEALQGAQQTIQHYKPKLAICIYHKPEDFFEIPLYINSIMPEYQLYIRHKSFCGAGETVCYAV